jgi:UDP-N-acetylmuramoyl-L-alanyl-D-glutamate--2,6-diaminopimelate ligase
MLDGILIFIKKFIPQEVFAALQPAYHFTLSWLAAVIYRSPSNKMIIVGVTGTTGKTSVVYITAEVLKNAGYKVGYLSTAMFSDGHSKWLNDKKMTMPGRFFTQKLLRQMIRNRCNVAIIETTSQGIVQFRHRFINYDILIFTGLYPEHIEAHGGFENYKKAKGKLFAHLKNCRKKNLEGKDIEKVIIANADDEHVQYFLDFWAEKKMVFGIKYDVLSIKYHADSLKARDVIAGIQDTRYKIPASPAGGQDTNFVLNLPGMFNVYNALAAISVAKTLGIQIEKIKEGLEKIKGIPGRFEKIPNKKDITIIVDYAYEPNAVLKLYETIENMPHGKTIHVLGSAGGGRDKSRRPILGKLAGEKADLIIITNEDPYDESPMEIINEVAQGAEDKKENLNLWKILDRREAIKKALALAEQGDLVLITGKGCEQAICIENGRKIPWDDRKVILEELQNTNGH